MPPFSQDQFRQNDNGQNFEVSRHFSLGNKKANFAISWFHCRLWYVELFCMHHLHYLKAVRFVWSLSKKKICYWKLSDNFTGYDCNIYQILSFPAVGGFPTWASLLIVGTCSTLYTSIVNIFSKLLYFYIHLLFKYNTHTFVYTQTIPPKFILNVILPCHLEHWRAHYTSVMSSS